MIDSCLTSWWGAWLCYQEFWLYFCQKAMVCLFRTQLIKCCWWKGKCHLLILTHLFSILRRGADLPRYCQGEGLVLVVQSVLCWRSKSLAGILVPVPKWVCSYVQLSAPNLSFDFEDWIKAHMRNAFVTVYCFIKVQGHFVGYNLFC